LRSAVQGERGQREGLNAWFYEEGDVVVSLDLWVGLEKEKRE